MNNVMCKTLIHREVRGMSFVESRMFTQVFKDSLTMVVTALRGPFKLVNITLFEFQGGEFSEGHRFTNTEQVVDRILRTISSNYGLWENPTPKNVQDVEREERMHLGVWAWEGLRDSASSDHWYKYEKRYD